MDKKRYKAAKGLKSVVGVPVDRGHVELTAAQALYPLAIGRITEPTKKKESKAVVVPDVNVEDKASG